MPGVPCLIRYNPDLTPLNGQNSISTRVGFDGWTHPTSYGPTKMKSLVQRGKGWCELEVEVPTDATVMDLEFAGEVWSADMRGLRDDNGGKGYKIPVGGGALSVGGGQGHGLYV